MFGASSRVSSRMYLSCPAMNDFPRVDRPWPSARTSEPSVPKSGVARAAFGDDVVDHYTNAARVELAAYDAAVTDWERFRGFERL